MPYCPCCDQPVEAKAIACPHCRSLLKAHGHPGILLHRATGEEFLCESCRYDADDTCTFPQRPDARECTLYRNQSALVSLRQDGTTSRARTWLQRNSRLLLLIGLGVIALLLAL